MLLGRPVAAPPFSAHEWNAMHLTLTSVVLFAGLAFPPAAAGQTTEPRQTPQASSPANDPPQALVPSSTPQPSAPFDRQVSWKRLLPNLVGDQERIWSFPARLVQGQDWISTAAVVGATAGLVALDPTEAAYFRRTSTFHAFNNIFTGKATLAGVIAAPLSLYATGLARKDPKM